MSHFTDLMRRGTQLCPTQTFHQYMIYHSVTRDMIGCCALGAVAIGYGDEHKTDVREMNKTWVVERIAEESYPHANLWGTFADGEYIRCPITTCARHDRHDRLDGILGVIVHLNDDHIWTREQIADWVDSVFEEGSRA